MKTVWNSLIPFFFLSLFLSNPSIAQDQQNEFIFGDPLPDAPELSARGTYQVGVRTLDLVDKGRLDVLNSSKDKNEYYNRPHKVEIWYPAKLTSDQKEFEVYEEVLGNANSEDRPLIPFTFKGRSCRDAVPLLQDQAYPLVIVSHGYTGSRLLFTYLTEHLASKGYVVVSIDHTESTFRDANGFHSTLLNRSLDDLFVLEEMSRLGEKKGDSFLAGLVDAENTALIGYSMGGYGALNVAGAGYSAAAAGFFASIANGNNALLTRSMGNEEYVNSMDSRVKVIVAMAPWGMEKGVWNEEGLAGIKLPTLFVAGTKDDISGYEKGIKAIYEGAINADRFLLSYHFARHNIAPNPPPTEAFDNSLHIDEYLRYADSVWDQRRINNINQHFISAFLGYHIKQEKEMMSYLQVDNSSEDWKGFKPRTTVGIQLDHSFKE